MLRRALFCGLAVLCAAPVFAANIATRTGTASAAFAIGSGGSGSMAINFAIAGGTSYNTVTAAPLLNTTNGSAATASAYLSSGIGPTATVLAGPIAISIPAGQTTPTATTITFTGVTLAGGDTYYLVISNGSGNLGWGANSGAGTETVGTGVTGIGADVQDLAFPNPPSPPTSATFTTPVSNGGSSHVLLFSVSGTVVGGGGGGGGSTGIPTLGTWAMFGTVLLLGFTGFMALRRQHQ